MCSVRDMFYRMRTRINDWCNNFSVNKVSYQFSVLFILLIVIANSVQLADGFKLKFGHQADSAVDGASEGSAVNYQNVTISNGKVHQTCEKYTKSGKCIEQVHQASHQVEGE